MSKTTADTDIRVRLCYQCWEPERGVMYFTTDREGKRSGAAEMHESGMCAAEVGKAREKSEESVAKYETIRGTLPVETRVIVDCFMEMRKSRGAAAMPYPMAYVTIAQKLIESLRENGVLPK